MPAFLSRSYHPWSCPILDQVSPTSFQSESFQKKIIWKPDEALQDLLDKAVYAAKDEMVKLFIYQGDLQAGRVPATPNQDLEMDAETIL
jgi:hypothetical protein